MSEEGKRIKKLIREGDGLREASIKKYVEAGRKLIAKKESLNHGEWLPWLEAEEIKPERAQECMRLAAALVDEKRGAPRISEDMSQREALAVIAKPRPKTRPVLVPKKSKKAKKKRKDVILSAEDIEAAKSIPAIEDVPLPTPIEWAQIHERSQEQNDRLGITCDGVTSRFSKFSAYLEEVDDLLDEDRINKRGREKIVWYIDNLIRELEALKISIAAADADNWTDSINQLLEEDNDVDD